MRADRLVAILLMLQRRDVVTAAEVADELEISVRTARRDLEALSMAGVPVYAQRGRGGGWSLLGGGRLDLSGLNADEARSLFLLTGPRAQLTPEVRSALRKLVRALPEPLRQGAEAAAEAVVVDPSGWDHGGGQRQRPAMLDALESAVVDSERIRLGYRARSGEVTDRVVHPLGLASKRSNWYLIADTDDGFRTFRVDRVERADRTGEPAVRPDGFELSEAWATAVEGIDQLRLSVVAHGTAVPEAVQYLRMVFGRRVQIGGEGIGGDEAGSAPTASDRVVVQVRGSSIRGLATDLAGFGSWVVIDEPAELCQMLGQLGAELVDTYRPT